MNVKKVVCKKYLRLDIVPSPVRISLDTFFIFSWIFSGKNFKNLDKILKNNSFLYKTEKIKKPTITNTNDNDVGPSKEIRESVKIMAIKKRKKIITKSNILSIIKIPRQEENEIFDLWDINKGLTSSPILRGNIALAAKPKQVMGNKVDCFIDLIDLIITADLKDLINKPRITRNRERIIWNGLRLRKFDLSSWRLTSLKDR